MNILGIPIIYLNAIAYASRYYEDDDITDWPQNNGNNGELGMMIGFATVFIILLIIIDKFFPRYEYPKITALIGACLAGYLSSSSLYTYAGIIAVIILILYACPLILVPVLIFISIFAPIFFIVALFTGCQYNDLLIFGIPTVFSIWFWTRRKKGAPP